MNFDADESELFDRLAHQRRHATAVGLRMDEREPVESLRPARHDARDLPVGHAVVRVKRWKQDCALYSCGSRSAHIFFQRRRRVPRSGQPVTFSSVAMAVYDHAFFGYRLPPSESHRYRA